MTSNKNFEDFNNDQELSDEEEIELDSSSKPQNINIICEENCRILVRKNKKGCSIEIRCCDCDDCDCEERDCDCNCDCEECDCHCNCYDCDCEYEN